MKLTDAECAVLTELLERVVPRSDDAYIDVPNTDENWDVVRMVEDQLGVEARHMRTRPPDNEPIVASPHELLRAFALRLGANR